MNSLRSLTCLRFMNSYGISYVNALTERPRFMRFVKLLTCFSIGHESRFICRERILSNFKFPISEGVVPSQLEISICTKLTNFPNSRRIPPSYKFDKYPFPSNCHNS
ncbi:hypothetical protein ABFX02_07G089000 [Erythranthe guttata]